MRGAIQCRWRWPSIEAEVGERALALSAELAKSAAPHFVKDMEAGEWQTQPFHDFIA